MSEEEKINLNIKFEENLPINKKRKRSLSHQNTQIKIKPSKKIKIDKQQEAKFENNILPISLEKNDKDNEDNNHSKKEKNYKINKKSNFNSYTRKANVDNTIQRDKKFTFSPTRFEGQYQDLYKADNSPKNNYISFEPMLSFSRTVKSSSTNNDIIERGINNLIENDPNESLMGLIELSNSLSLASDSILSNSKLDKLMIELINLFDKCCLPEVLIQALICLNYILDINPSLARVLKNDGINKLIIQTQNIEYIDLAENAIKAIEKISSEMPEFLLENDAFNSILLFIEFFDLNLRKSALNVCYRLSKYIRNNIVLQSYIVPALPNLTNLTKFSGNSEIEKFILDSAIGCFYNIIRCIKSYKLDSTNLSIYHKLNEYGLISNLFEVVIQFLNLFKNNENPTSAVNSKSSKSIGNYVETTKKIFLIFDILSSKSDTIANSFLDIEIKFCYLNFNMSIFEIISTILDSEIGGINYNNNKEKSNNDSLQKINRKGEKTYPEYDQKLKAGSFHTILNNIYSFLSSLYPSEGIQRNISEDSSEKIKHVKDLKVIHKLCNSKQESFDWNYEQKSLNLDSNASISNDNENLISLNNPVSHINSIEQPTLQENKLEMVENDEVKVKNLKFLINQIIPKTIKNFINFSSSNSTFKMLKFLKIFIMNSNKELIKKSVNPLEISNIFSKFIDSKDAMYILEIYEIIDIIMNLCPENFMLEFIRDGVFDNIEKLDKVKKTEMIIDNSYFKSNSFYFQEKYKHILKNESFHQADTNNFNVSNANAILTVNKSDQQENMKEDFKYTDNISVDESHQNKLNSVLKLDMSQAYEQESDSSESSEEDNEESEESSNEIDEEKDESENYDEIDEEMENQEFDSYDEINKISSEEIEQEESESSINSNKSDVEQKENKPKMTIDSTTNQANSDINQAIINPQDINPENRKDEAQPHNYKHKSLISALDELEKISAYRNNKFENNLLKKEYKDKQTFKEKKKEGSSKSNFDNIIEKNNSKEMKSEADQIRVNHATYKGVNKNLMTEINKDDNIMNEFTIPFGGKSFYKNSLKSKIEKICSFSKEKSPLKIDDEIFLIIQKRSKEFINKYCNEAYQKELLKYNNIQESPIEILKQLESLSKRFLNKDFDIGLVKEFFEILLNKKITFYEMDKSSIITNFAFYIDKNLSLNINSVKEISIANLSFDENIICKIKAILNSLNNEETKIIKFLEILQFGITSMNCFKINIQDSNKPIIHSFAYRSAFLEEEYNNILKTNISENFSDSEFKHFNMKNYIKKTRVEFIYRPNEEIINDYFLDPFFLDLHNYYTSEEKSYLTTNMASEAKNGRSFKLEIDPDELFSSIGNAFIKKKYFDKDIINKPKADDIKENEYFNSKFRSGNQINDTIHKNTKTPKNKSLNNIIKEKGKEIEFDNENENNNQKNKSKSSLDDFLYFAVDTNSRSVNFPSLDLLHSNNIAEDPNTQLKEIAESNDIFHNNFYDNFEDILMKDAEYFKNNISNQQKVSSNNKLLMRKDSQVSNANSENLIINVNENSNSNLINSPKDDINKITKIQTQEIYENKMEIDDELNNEEKINLTKAESNLIYLHKYSKSDLNINKVDKQTREEKESLTKKESFYKIVFFVEIEEHKSNYLEARSKMKFQDKASEADNDKQQKKSKIFIEENQTLKSFMRKIKNKYTSSELLSFIMNIKICFEISLNDNYSNEQTIRNNRIESFKKNDRKLTDISLFDTVNDILTSCNELEKDVIIPDEIIFKKIYLEKLLRNPALYCVEKATEYFYLISIIYLSTIEFSHLFNIENNRFIKKEFFENKKINSLLSKQVSDFYSISLKTIPNWCAGLSLNFPFLSDFNSRYLFFKTCTFDVKRSFNNLLTYNKKELGEGNIMEKMPGNKRRKLMIDRKKIMESVHKIIDINKDFKGYIEFEYAGETGSGIGPTLEFYSLVFSNLKERKTIWYKTTNETLFPMPQPTNVVSNQENSKLFLILGYVIARGIYDDRLIDIPLNPLFWDIVLDKPLTVQKISLIDVDLHKVIQDLLKIAARKREILNNNSNKTNQANEKGTISNRANEQQMELNKDEHNSNVPTQVDLNNILLYNNCRLDEIGINFTLPGYDIELKEKGSETLLNAYNLEEYINLIFKCLCFEGISESVKSFKKGFNLVFPIKSMRCFHSYEVYEYICGSYQEEWNESILMEAILPNHGYDKNSITYKHLIKFMIELDETKKKKFLSFVTGSTRLPLGGIKNLNPKLTVVKKHPDNVKDNPDSYLPTVMTCQNYLKIPEYSSYEVFKAKIFTAMLEGLNSFYLS